MTKAQQAKPQSALLMWNAQFTTLLENELYLPPSKTSQYPRLVYARKTQDGVAAVIKFEVRKHQVLADRMIACMDGCQSEAKKAEEIYKHIPRWKYFKKKKAELDFKEKVDGLEGMKTLFLLFVNTPPPIATT